MWFERPARIRDWSAATRHLRGDPVMRRLIRQVGPCTLHPRRDHFVVLCKSIFTQQISTAVAGALFARLCAMCPARRPTPRRVIELAASDGALRSCGLSAQKQRYLVGLAHHFAGGSLAGRRLSRLGDEQVIAALVQIDGIGRWTAQMFLIFALNRPDVLPVDDLGLRQAAMMAYGLPARPSAAELTALAEPWQPWRSVATWYLWRSAARQSSERARPALAKPSPRAGPAAGRVARRSESSPA
jgi:DNA-3-methyladenine glycosylase II